MASTPRSTTLLENQTSNGSSTFIRWNGPVRSEFFEVAGTLDGASVALEITRDGGTTVHEIVSLGAVDIVAVDLPDCELRATVSGAGASTDVTVRL